MLARVLTVAVAIVSSVSVAFGCTAVNILAADGTVVAARSMEWALDMKWALVHLPKGTAVQLAAPESADRPEKTVETTHAIVGVTTDLVPGNVLLDGTNDAGLTMSGNFLPGFTTYQTVTAADEGYVSIYEFGAWSLGMFDSVAALRDGLSTVKVWWDGKTIGGSPPDLHFVFTDKTGESVVLEFVNGEQMLHDNIVQVLTNAPTYDWHLNNLRNYLDLRSTAVTSVNIGTADVTSLGQGGGLRGVPADYTPPARFVKSAYVRHFAQKPKNAAEAVSLAGHVMNTVDIPYGVVQSKEGKSLVTDYTQWIVIKDVTNGSLRIADYDNRTNFLEIDLDSVFAGGQAAKVPVSELPYPTGDALTALSAN